MKRSTLAITLDETTRYRLSVGLRVLAAVFGSYQLASAVAFFLGLEDGHWSQLVTPAVHLLVLLWLFHTRSATRAWTWLIVWTLVVYGVSWLIIHQRGLGA